MQSLLLVTTWALVDKHPAGRRGKEPPKCQLLLCIVDRLLVHVKRCLREGLLHTLSPTEDGARRVLRLAIRGTGPSLGALVVTSYTGQRATYTIGQMIGE